MYDKIRARSPRAYSLGLPVDRPPEGRRLARGRDPPANARDLKGVKLRTRGGYFAPLQEAVQSQP